MSTESGIERDFQIGQNERYDAGIDTAGDHIVCIATDARKCFSNAVQYGVARGIYSNDAGTGYGMIAHASAQTDHPVRQSLWGWGEVFIDTFIICSITAFTIIMTGSYTTSDATSGAKIRHM